VADTSEPEERADVEAPIEDAGLDRYAAVVREEPLGPPSQESSRTHAVVAAASYRGPWPDPRTMAAYKEIDPSFPERIVKAWEDEGQHRRDLERREVAEFERSGAHARRIRWAGVATSAAIVVAAVACAFLFQQYWLLFVLVAGGGIGIGIGSLRRRPAPPPQAE
jgi:uncharacterized membrane protein